MSKRSRQCVGGGGWVNRFVPLPHYNCCSARPIFRGKKNSIPYFRNALQTVLTWRMRELVWLECHCRYLKVLMTGKYPTAVEVFVCGMYESCGHEKNSLSLGFMVIKLWVITFKDVEFIRKIDVIYTHILCVQYGSQLITSLSHRYTIAEFCNLDFRGSENYPRLHVKWRTSFYIQ